ncbi:hypothetical protein PWT90_10034 [Aphanocladium album]|nr:hypothetical protein PWT90_10034 [Aphanocladium album]
MDGRAAEARETRRGAHSCDPPSVRVTARLPRKHVIELVQFGWAARAGCAARERDSADMGMWIGKGWSGWSAASYHPRMLPNTWPHPGHQGRPSRPQPRLSGTFTYRSSTGATLHRPLLSCTGQRAAGPPLSSHLALAKQAKPPILLSRTTNFPSQPAPSLTASNCPYSHTRYIPYHQDIPHHTALHHTIHLVPLLFCTLAALADQAVFDPPRLACSRSPSTPAMNNKNWNDRADKDLFFTILSVKNIGVISGAEWTTIGNHMRTMGYGFTNEGCRQHFQGLRRALNKVESSAPAAESATRRVDPTLNPITRRPGPGRGRPRKSQAAAGEGGSSTGPESADNSTITPLDPNMSASPGLPGSVPVHDPALQPQAMEMEEDGGLGGQQTAEEDEQALAASAGGAYPDAAAQELPDGTADEHPSKRQRLESDVMDHEAALDDEAVLALATHNGTTPADYAEFGYGDA